MPLATGANALTVATKDGLGLADAHAAQAAIDSQSTIDSPFGIAHDAANGRLLLTEIVPPSVTAVDLATGDRTVLSGAGAGTGPDFVLPWSIALDGNRALVADRDRGAVIAVDLANGDRTILSDAATGTGPTISPQGIAVDGGRALVTDRFLHAVVAVDLLTGDRTVLSDAATGTGPAFEQDLVQIAIDGTRALVTNSNNACPGVNQVMAVDLATGDRTLLSGPGTGSGVDLCFPWGIAVDGARALVADNGNLRLFSIDLSTGDRTIVSDSATGAGTELLFPANLVVDGSRVLMIDPGLPAVVAVDLATGDRTIISGASRGAGPWISIVNEGIVVDGGRALVTALGSVFAVDLASGDRSVLSDASTGSGPPFGNAFTGPRGIALNGTHALVTDGDLLAVMSVDLANGDRAIVSDAATGTGPPLLNGAPAIAMDGTHALVVDGFSVLAVDPATGDRTVVTNDVTGTGQVIQIGQGLARDGSRLLVTDLFAQAVFAVDPATGDRTILSDSGTGAGPVIQAPSGIAMDGTRALVTDRILNSVIAVDTTTGDRTVVYDGTASAYSSHVFSPLAIVLHDGHALVVESDGNYGGLAHDRISAVDLLHGQRVTVSR